MKLINSGIEVIEVEVIIIKKPSKKTLMMEYYKDNNISNYGTSFMIFI